MDADFYRTAAGRRLCDHTLPRLADALERVAASIERRAGRPAVLVVDDDARLLATLCRALELSVDTYSASSAEAAAAALRAQPFTAVISDLDMQRDGEGFEVLRLARALQPAARRVLMSGSETLRARHGDDGPAQFVFAKPVSIEALLLAACGERPETPTNDSR